jgi:CubicO group peptidase (beta-lactamase class C family)
MRLRGRWGFRSPPEIHPFHAGASVRARIILALLTSLSSALLRAQTNPDVPPDLDAWVARSLTAFQTPGIAIAIVKDGRVVLTKGYGVRRAGGNEPVTEHTIFQVASNTKAFTAALLAQLVDEGRIHWTDRVIDHLPWFAMYDPYVTRELTVEDLLVHRSGLGLGGGDLLWFHSDYSRDEILRRLRYVRPATSFRSAYAYDNVLYIAAGELAGSVAGMPWDSLVARRIFQPLGMSNTNTTVTAWPGPDVAVPHGMVDGRLRVVPVDTVDNIGGAGSINSNVLDMAQWVRVLLDSGRIDATHRLWTAERTGELWQGRTITAGSRAGNLSEYALGWNVSYVNGTKTITHTGGLAGMISRVYLIPSQRIGFVILTNCESSAMGALTNLLRDYYLNAPPVDYIARLSAPSARFNEAAFEAKLDSAHARGTSPSLPIERHAGTYRDAWYGDVTIAREGTVAGNGINIPSVPTSGLVIRFSHSPTFTGDLIHWHHDTFRVRWRVRSIPDAWVQFQLKPDGKVDRVLMAAVSPSADFSFNWQDLELIPVAR